MSIDLRGRSRFSKISAADAGKQVQPQPQPSPTMTIGFLEYPKDLELVNPMLGYRSTPR